MAVKYPPPKEYGNDDGMPSLEQVDKAYSQEFKDRMDRKVEGWMNEAKKKKDGNV